MVRKINITVPEWIVAEVELRSKNRSQGIVELITKGLFYEKDLELKTNNLRQKKLNPSAGNVEEEELCGKRESVLKRHLESFIQLNKPNAFYPYIEFQS